MTRRDGVPAASCQYQCNTEAAACAPQQKCWQPHRAAEQALHCTAALSAPSVYHRELGCRCGVGVDGGLDSWSDSCSLHTTGLPIVSLNRATELPGNRQALAAGYQRRHVLFTRGSRCPLTEGSLPCLQQFTSYCLLLAAAGAMSVSLLCLTFHKWFTNA